MRIIFKIAQTEIRKLFYSPVAWLVLVIFLVQTGYQFSGLYGNIIQSQAAGYPRTNITRGVFTDLVSLYPRVLGYLYLYIPLITMGLMSREFSIGSIKLLYSSPVSNWQIVAGKFLGFTIMAVILTGILLVFVLCAGITIENAEVPMLLCGLLGVFLLMLAYGAIGLFMSTLTSYMVVAAIGTLTVFSLLDYVRTLWQDVSFVRDLTYWLSLSGRVNTFIEGMLTSEDFLYFIILVLLFLSLTVVRLNNVRQKSKGWTSAQRYLLPVIISLIAGFLTSLPKLKMYVDVTRGKENTITASSQEIIAKLPPNTTITSYANMLGNSTWSYLQPAAYKYDAKRFDRYLRFDPTIRLKYEYYYHGTNYPDLDNLYPGLSDEQRLDTLKKLYEWKFKILPYSLMRKDVDLAGEGFRSVRMLTTPAGKRSFLRFFDDARVLPDESEISAAFKRLVDPTPVAGFVTGFGVQSISDESDRGYSLFAHDKTFRYSLINQGFDIENITLQQTIPARISLLVIPPIKRQLDTSEQRILGNYIAGGGNLLILGKPGTQDYMNDITSGLGVNFLPGMLVHPLNNQGQTLNFANVTGQGRNLTYFLDYVARSGSQIIFPVSGALQIHNTGNFDVYPMLTTSGDSSWTELETKDFNEDTARFNPTAGELRGNFPLMVALSRKAGGKIQRIIISADGSWLSNGELGTERRKILSGNYSLVNGIFSFFTYGQLPIDMRRPAPLDNRITLDKKTWSVVELVLKWILPGLIVLIAVIGWIRRRGR